MLYDIALIVALTIAFLVVSASSLGSDGVRGMQQVASLLMNASSANGDTLNESDTLSPCAQLRDDPPLSLSELKTRLLKLGINADRYARTTGLSIESEPAALTYAGRDRYKRPLCLTINAARAWHTMCQAAVRDGILLDAISGYRSYAYQLDIFEHKLAQGQTLAQILTVNAAPGFSEHHSGEALDIGMPGEPPVDESFERTTAFAWLQRHARTFGFHLSFPRNNPHGIVYEPWHWRWRAG
nr:M15 family metallopeptidase [Xylella taiwanensis]